MRASGKCLCGAVRYTAEDVSTDVHACHCGMCRRWSGGPALAVQVGPVTFEDEEHLVRYQSSDWAERGFCRQCGSGLFYRIRETGDYVFWMGSFDDQEAFSLVGEIYVDEKPQAYDFAGEHPRLTGAEFLASMGIAPDV